MIWAAPFGPTLFKYQLAIFIAICLIFIYTFFQDAAQRSRMKRIEGSNILKEENDRLRREEHITNSICENGRKKRSGKQEIKNELEKRSIGIQKALKRLRKQQQRGQRPYDK